jgi:hypothetical protein
MYDLMSSFAWSIAMMPGTKFSFVETAVPSLVDARNVSDEDEDGLV